MSIKKKVLIWVGIVFAILICIYFGVTIYFMSHFYQGTKINNVDFSMKTEEEVQAHFAKQVDGYSLSIRPQSGSTETIKASDISIKYQKSENIKKELSKQNSFLWPSMFWKSQDVHVDLGFDYDKGQLKKKIESLQAFSNEGKVDPVSAKPEFKGDTFAITPEVVGTKVDQEKMTKVVVDGVGELTDEVNLVEAECYGKPKYTTESKEVKEATEKLNQYVKASITYDMVPNQEVVDKQMISGWLTYDESMKVTFNEDKVREYMKTLAAKYDTLGATRTITTPGGKVVDVSGGTYGWSIDEAAESDALIASIKAGEQVTREPVYVQRGLTHEGMDWGNTYIEVDLSAQYMWYIVNGAVALETPVVTGKPSTGHATPAGVYEVLLMQAPSVLVGNIMPETGEPEYRTEVRNWMQITWGGVGFHDADWQPTFGGDWYLEHGSHGCINMPVDMAASLYSMVTWGTPAVIHF